MRAQYVSVHIDPKGAGRAIATQGHAVCVCACVCTPCALIPDCAAKHSSAQHSLPHLPSDRPAVASADEHGEGRAAPPAGVAAGVAAGEGWRAPREAAQRPRATRLQAPTARWRRRARRSSPAPHAASSAERSPARCWSGEPAAGCCAAARDRAPRCTGIAPCVCERRPAACPHERRPTPGAAANTVPDAASRSSPRACRWRRQLLRHAPLCNGIEHCEPPQATPTGCRCRLGLEIRPSRPMTAGAHGRLGHCVSEMPRRTLLRRRACLRATLPSTRAWTRL